MSESELATNPPVGYGQPPKETRFQKGRSGNPKGRPRGSFKQVPYENILGQMVTVREDGRERRVTAAEAFILQLTQKGLAGDSAAARASLTAIEAARASRLKSEGPPPVRFVVVPFGANSVLCDLGIAAKRNRLSKEKVRVELQPWIVQEALERLGTRQLTPAEQREVWTNTRTPEKVRWPEWWTFRG